MAVYYLKTDEDIACINRADPSFQVGDILVTKPWELYVIEKKMKYTYPNIELFPISPGTDLYTLYGYNSCVITGGVDASSAPPVPLPLNLLRSDILILQVKREVDETAFFTLKNGQKIPAQYQLFDDEEDTDTFGTLTIPFLADCTLVDTPIYINGGPVFLAPQSTMTFDPLLGKYNNAAAGGFSDGDFITIKVQYYG